LVSPIPSFGVIERASITVVGNVASNGAGLSPIVNSITITDVPPHPITAKAITTNVAGNGAGIGPIINSPTRTNVPPHTITAKAITSNVAGNGAGLGPIINSNYISVLPEHTIIPRAITTNVAGNGAGIGPVINSNYIPVFPGHTITAKAVTTNVAANSAGLGPIMNSVHVSDFPPHPITFGFFKRDGDQGKPKKVPASYSPDSTLSFNPGGPIINVTETPKHTHTYVFPPFSTTATPVTSINPGGPIINATETPKTTCTDPPAVPITKTHATFPSVHVSPTPSIGVIQIKDVSSVHGGPGPVKPHTTSTPTSFHGGPGPVKPHSTSSTRTLEPGFFGPKARGDGHYEPWEHNPGPKVPFGPKARSGFVTSIIRAVV
jgi:hypothetical protein